MGSKRRLNRISESGPGFIREGWEEAIEGSFVWKGSKEKLWANIEYGLSRSRIIAQRKRAWAFSLGVAVIVFVALSLTLYFQFFRPLSPFQYQAAPLTPSRPSPLPSDGPSPTPGRESEIEACPAATFAPLEETEKIVGFKAWLPQEVPQGFLLVEEQVYYNAKDRVIILRYSENSAEGGPSDFEIIQAPEGEKKFLSYKKEASERPIGFSPITINGQEGLMYELHPEPGDTVSPGSVSIIWSQEGFFFKVYGPLYLKADLLEVASSITPPTP